MMTAIISFFTQFFQKFATHKLAELGFKSSIETAKFIAWKTIIVTLMFSGSLVAVSLILEYVFTEIFEFIGSQISGTSIENVNFTLNASGFFGYLIDVLRIDDALRMIVSALITKFTLKFIPFVRL